MEATLAQLPSSHLRLSDLTNRRATPFELVPTSEERGAIAKALDIVALKKLRFVGELSPMGKKDWALKATLGASVVQECVVTLSPVSTRIDETIARRYMADLPEVDAAEIEMPEDDTVDPLPDSLDLADVMIEALSLALPAYPRADDAQLAQSTFAEPGVTPMTDEEAKPFAGLSGLKEALENKGK